MKRVSVYTHTYFSVYKGTPQAPAVQKDKGLLWLPFQSMTKVPLSLFAIPNSWSFFSTLKQHVHIINITLYKFKYIYIYIQTMCHSQEIFTLKLFIKADWIPRKKKSFIKTSVQTWALIWIQTLQLASILTTGQTFIQVFPHFLSSTNPTLRCVTHTH